MKIHKLTDNAGRSIFRDNQCILLNVWQVVGSDDDGEGGTERCLFGTLPSSKAQAKSAGPPSTLQHEFHLPPAKVTSWPPHRRKSYIPCQNTSVHGSRYEQEGGEGYKSIDKDAISARPDLIILSEVAKESLTRINLRVKTNFAGRQF